MKKLILSLVIVMLWAGLAYSIEPGLVNITEVDGVPAPWVYKIIFPNGAVTDNANATVTINIGSIATDSLWDAIGDLAVGTGANTAGILSAGTENYILTMGAATPAWSGTINITTLNLPSSNADPGTTAGQIRHDSTVTALTGGAVKWFNGTNVRILLDLDTEPVAGDDEKAVLYDDGNKKFYLGSVAAGGNAYPWFPAGSMVPDTSSGLLQNDSNPNMFDYLAFDGATDEYALFYWSAEDWNLGTIKAKFVWAASAAMTNAHTVIWGLNCYAVSDGDTIDVAFDTGAVTVSDAYTTGDETGPIQKTSAATAAITVQGTPAAGDVVYCRVHRDADTDTSTIDAWLIGVKIEYTKTTPSAW